MCLYQLLPVLQEQCDELDPLEADEVEEVILDVLGGALGGQKASQADGELAHGQARGRFVAVEFLREKSTQSIGENLLN